MRVWLQEQGYPTTLMDVAIKHSRYWEVKEDINEK